MANALTAKQAVRVFLATHGKTQVWLAGRLKVSQSTLSEVLSGHRQPSAELAEKLAKLTGVDLRSSEAA